MCMYTEQYCSVELKRKMKETFQQEIHRSLLLGSFFLCCIRTGFSPICFEFVNIKSFCADISPCEIEPNIGSHNLKRKASRRLSNFHAPACSAENARGIENAARRSPITIASEIYRFTVADNSILFLHPPVPAPPSRSFFPRASIYTEPAPARKCIRRAVVPHPRGVVMPSAMCTRCRNARQPRNIVRLDADFDTAPQRN